MAVLPSRARAFAEAHGIKRWHESHEALVADPQIDIVYVASPHSEHKRLALLAIAAGKHILVEKPVALTAAEAREIRDAARSAGVFAMEAMWTRYLPQTDVMMQLMDDGTLGQLELVLADFDAVRPTRKAASTIPRTWRGAPSLISASIPFGSATSGLASRRRSRRSAT